MDLQSLELRQLTFVDAFTQVGSERSLIKSFIAIFFAAVEKDEFVSPSVSSSIDPIDISGASPLLPLPAPDPDPDPTEQAPPPLLTSSNPPLASTALVVVESTPSTPRHPPSSQPSRKSRCWSLLLSRSKPGSVVPRFSPTAPSLSTVWIAALAADRDARARLAATFKVRYKDRSAAEDAAQSRGAELKVVFGFPGLNSPVTYPQSVRAMGLCQAFHNKSEGDVYGRSEGFVHGSCTDIAAFYLDNDSEYNKNNLNRLANPMLVDEKKENCGGAVMVTLAKPNDHSRIILRRVPPPPGFPFDGREFVSFVTWKRVSQIKVILIYNPTTHEDAPLSNDFVRATNLAYTEFTEVKPGLTHVQTFYHANLRGNLPTSFTTLLIPHHLLVKDCVTYFQYLVPLSDMTERKGRDLGDLLMEAVLATQKKAGWKHKVIVVVHELEVFFGRSAALRDLSAVLPTFKPLLKAILEKRVAPPGVVTKRLAELSSAEAKRIGSFLAGEIAVGVNSESAVDNWIASQPALIELEKEYVWFRPFIHAIALRQLVTSNWGLKVRVIVGAGLSVGDMISDIYMIYNFWITGREQYAKANLAMILTNMLLQLCISLAATSKMKSETKIKEALFVLLCIKPGVDAFRIATDWESKEIHTIDPWQELVLSRGCETIIEAIPAAASQSYALFAAKERSLVAFVSIFISLATTSFTVSSMAFDADISPEKRAANPEFYGFVISDRRMVTLFLLSLLTFFHTTMKLFASILVAVVNPTVLLVYLSVDMMTFLIFKIFRGDFIYVIFSEVSPSSVMFSMLERIIVKLLTDFTGSLTCRHNYQMTPFCWLWSLFLLPLSSSAFAHYYNVQAPHYYAGHHSSGAKLPPSTVWAAVGGLVFCWAVVGATLINNINRKYLHTFYGTQTASQFLISAFRSAGEDDERKALIFKKGFHAWKSIEREVREWVHANFEKWEREKPEWWTKKLIQKIPEEVLSKEEIATLLSAGKKRRKSSVLQDAGFVE